MSENPLKQTLRKKMNDPGFEWARARRMRQTFVLVFFGLVLLQPTLPLLTGSFLSILLLIIPLMFVMGMLNAGIRGMTELRSRDLDEREEKIRNTVYAKLYWPGVLLGMVSAVMMSSLSGDARLLVVAAGLSIFFIAIALPALWLAWSLPDEPGAG